MVNEPSFGKSLFICSRPVQFLHCASIIRRYRVTDPEMFVIAPRTAEITEFLSFIRASAYNELFCRVRLCHDYREVANQIRLLEHESLFIEDDRMSRYRLLKPLKTNNMVVFEKGFETYKDDYRKRLPLLRKAKWVALSRLTGCGLFIGEGRATDYVMVQYPEVYAACNPATARKALHVPRLLDEFSYWKRDWEVIIEKLGIDVSDDVNDIGLVLGSRDGAPFSELHQILKFHEVVYYKAHPHAGSLIGVDAVRNVGTSWIPAEAVIDYLASRCTSLAVYHFASTAYLNCYGRYTNVSFIRLVESSRFAEVTQQLQLAFAGASDSVSSTSAQGEAPQPNAEEVTFAVVIPSCDRPLMVRRAVESVLSQSHQPDEIVVVDNGRERLATSAFPERVRVLQAPTRSGVSQARNIGAAVCSSDFIAFLDDDDCWHHDYLKEIAAACSAQRQANVFVASRHDSVTLMPIGPKTYEVPKNPISLIRRNPGIVGSTLTIRRQTLLMLGGFDTTLTAGEDSDFAIRVRKCLGEISYVERAIAFYDQSHEQSRLTGKMRHLFAAKRLLIRKHVPSRLLGLVLLADYGSRLAFARMRGR